MPHSRFQTVTVITGLTERFMPFFFSASLSFTQTSFLIHGSVAYIWPCSRRVFLLGKQPGVSNLTRVSTLKAGGGAENVFQSQIDAWKSYFTLTKDFVYWLHWNDIHCSLGAWMHLEQTVVMQSRCCWCLGRQSPEKGNTFSEFDLEHTGWFTHITKHNIYLTSWFS